MSKFRKAVSMGCILILLFHFGMCLYFTFSEARTSKDDPMPLSFYKYVVHLGPFFNDAHIQSSTSFIVGHQRDDKIEYKNLTKDFVEAYHNEPWRYHLLFERDFVRRAAGVLNKNQQQIDRTTLTTTKPYKGLYEYSIRAFPEAMKGDTIHWLFVLKWFDPARGEKRDTLFQVPITR